MRKSAAKPAAKKPMAKSGSNNMASKLSTLRKENKELKAQLKGSGGKKGADETSKKESMKEKMDRLRSMRKKK